MRSAQFALVFSTLLWSLLAQLASAQPGLPQDADEPVHLIAAAPGPLAAPPSADAAPSVAERIARLERSIESDEKRLRTIKSVLTNPDGEYARAEASFKSIDAQRSELRGQLGKSEDAGSAENWARLKDEAASVDKKWELAKERFDLVITGRKSLQETVVTLERKLQSDRETLQKLHGGAHHEAAAAATEAQTNAAQPLAHAPAPAANALPMPPSPTAPPAPATNPAEAAPTSAELAKAALDPTKLSDKISKLSLGPSVSKRVAEELAAARENLQKSDDTADAAEAEAAAINERIQILQQDITQHRTLRDTARKMVDNADQTLKNLNEELFRKLMDGQDITDLKHQIRDTSERSIKTRDYSRQVSSHLDDLQSTLALLQDEHQAANNDAMNKRQAAKLAEAAVAKLEYPFSLQKIILWLGEHGPKILIICIALFVLLRVSRAVETRLVSLIASHGRRGSREDRENRAKTLLGVFNNAAKLSIICGGVLMVLDEIGISIAPVIGGAAVLGLAVAFGAQSLIKDYFTGFMVLLEQQYLINDVIRVGDISGQVERISLRMTVLRDTEGRVHFIPHGHITTVTNLTHGWSRAVFDVSVSYKERVDDVMAVLKKLADDMRQEDAYRMLITSEPVMLGVDSLANSAVVIKFYIQTRPLQQWVVKREMLRRIKNEFDRIGIEIPFPHLMIYQGATKHLEAAPPNPAEDAERWPRRGVA
jgi:small conductance mechanosensitive channel